MLASKLLLVVLVIVDETSRCFELIYMTALRPQSSSPAKLPSCRDTLSLTPANMLELQPSAP